MSAFVRHDAYVPQEDVSVSLTGDEALVLFDLLHRWEDAEQVGTPQDKAEQVAVWNLSAALEKVLIEPFNPDYARLVSESRERLAPTE